MSLQQAPPDLSAWPDLPTVDPPGGNGGSAVAVTLRYAPFAFLLASVTPVLTIDGLPVPAGWGRVVTPVSPGEHHVHVHLPYLAPRVGAADGTVVAAPGRTAELEYRAPALAFMRGALGPPPQRYPGLALTVTLLAVLFTAAVCGCASLLVNALER